MSQQTDVSIVDPNTSKPTKVGTIGLPLGEAKEKFIREAGAMGATPSKVRDEPGRTTVIFPQSEPTKKLLDHYDPNKKLPRNGDVPGAYVLGDSGAKKGEYTPS